jgi:hypothetical protein
MSRHGEAAETKVTDEGEREGKYGLRADAPLAMSPQQAQICNARARAHTHLLFPPQYRGKWQLRKAASHTNKLCRLIMLHAKA